MSWPAPQAGLVVRYSYLWDSEARAGREEGVKDRPCAIVVVVTEEGKRPRVRVLPVTHTPPHDAADAVEIPQVTKSRLGLDSERSWIVLTEANDFYWPGPDLRMQPGQGPESCAYGFLPPRFFMHVVERLRLRRQALIARSE